jgi:hypothetical protein
MPAEFNAAHFLIKNLGPLLGKEKFDTFLGISARR